MPKKKIKLHPHVPRPKKIKPTLPLTVTIPVPSYIPRARGIRATTRFGDVLRVRCSLDETLLLDEACDMLLINRSAFIRWCIQYVSEEVLKHKL